MLPCVRFRHTLGIKFQQTYWHLIRIESHKILPSIPLIRLFCLCLSPNPPQLVCNLSIFLSGSLIFRISRHFISNTQIICVAVAVFAFCSHITASLLFILTLRALSLSLSLWFTPFYLHTLTFSCWIACYIPFGQNIYTKIAWFKHMWSRLSTFCNSNTLSHTQFYTFNTHTQIHSLYQTHTHTRWHTLNQSNKCNAPTQKHTKYEWIALKASILTNKTLKHKHTHIKKSTSEPYHFS